MVDALPRREVVMREQAPGAAATHHIEDRASRISRKGCTLGRPEALGMGRWGSIRAHSASERSVWYALLTSCPVSYRATTSRSLFRRFLRGSFAKGASGGCRSRMRASVLLTPGGHHAPTALSVRPLRRRVGHPRTVALLGRKAWPPRHVADAAVFYLLRSGCAWRMLPKESTLRQADGLLPSRPSSPGSTAPSR
jgi:hypothetical protein